MELIRNWSGTGYSDVTQHLKSIIHFTLLYRHLEGFSTELRNERQTEYRRMDVKRWRTCIWSVMVECSAGLSTAEQKENHTAWMNRTKEMKRENARMCLKKNTRLMKIIREEMFRREYFKYENLFFVFRNIELDDEKLLMLVTRWWD